MKASYMKKSDLKKTIKSVVREAISEKIQNFKISESQGGMSIQKDYSGENERMRKMEEAGLTSEKKDKWIQKSINPTHAGFCTPMTKSTCTPRRKALAMRFKKGDLSEEQILQELDSFINEEMGLSYKVADPQLRVQSDDQARTVQYDPEMTEEKIPVDFEPEINFEKVIQVLTTMAQVIDKKPEVVKKGLLDLAKNISQQTRMKEASYKKVSPNETDTEKEDKAKSIQTKPDVDENHKVQHRSFATVNDLPNDPNNVRDPENPNSDGA